MLDVTQELRFRRPRPSEVTAAWSPGVSLIWHADEGPCYENPRNRFCYFRTL